MQGQKRHNIYDYKNTVFIIFFGNFVGFKVIDIKNAHWAGATQIFNLDNSIVKSIKVSQFSLQPAVLRIVLSSDVHE